jgi:Lrp/AsnC family transcriptional regulator, regulator for asnA, asnC and gidA
MAARGIDELDRKIVALLQQKGRMSNVDIAREVHVTEATIRKRLERLLSEDVIRIVAIPNHDQVGFPIETIISLQVELLQLEVVSKAIGEMEPVRWVKLTTGEYDVIFDAVFRADEELLRFLTDQVATIPGVIKTATSHVLRQVRSIYEWVLPGERAPLILIVDDDPDFVEVMRTVLNAEGYQVRSASSGDEALRIMRVEQPDLVILDVMMRGILDGIRASEEMRRDKRLRRVPILMISSITSSDYASMFPTDQYLSVDSFFSKPIDPQRLLKEVEELLGR